METTTKASKAKKEKTPAATKTRAAKIMKEKRLTLSDINSVLYATGKTTHLTPVQKDGASWSTSSTLVANGKILKFVKSKGSIVATVNDENPTQILNRSDVEAFVNAAE